MEDYDKHYAALGLRPGATLEEIRASFLRMAKLYHPDQDASLDAEMRYREARRAYDVLRAAAGFFLHVYSPILSLFSRSWIAVGVMVFLALLMLWAHPITWMERQGRNL